MQTCEYDADLSSCKLNKRKFVDYEKRLSLLLTIHRRCEH